MKLTKKDTKVEDLLKEGEFTLIKADLAIATTPKQLYNQWQKAIKKGYGPKIDIDEYLEKLIVGTTIDLKERIQKTSNMDKRKQLVKKWREEFDTCGFRFDDSLKIKQLLDDKASELVDMARTNCIDVIEN